jgi:hypothetical protein
MARSNNTSKGKKGNSTFSDYDKSKGIKLKPYKREKSNTRNLTY